jgi:hypothetical protein
MLIVIVYYMYLFPMETSTASVHVSKYKAL